MRLVVTGGGSGGHLSPALAVIAKLKEKFVQKNERLDILFIGGTLGMEGTKGPSAEQTVLPKTDIPHVFICAGKLQRRVSLTSSALIWGIIPGFLQSFYHLLKFKPDLIFSTGGFVSVPVVLAGWFLRIPTVLHEQTAAVGLANKIGSFFAKIVAISFLSSEKEFSKKKVVLTGNPIRPAILAVRGVRFLRLQKETIEEYPLLYITGGSFGSHIINEVIGKILPHLLEKYVVVHQCGDNDVYQDYVKLLELKERLPKNTQLRYTLLKYLDEKQLAEVFEKTAFSISRAGANTVNELMALGIPAILVPIPWVQNNEQYKNARVLVNLGLGSILPENELTADRLINEIESFAKRQEEFKERSLAVLAKEWPDAAEKLAEIIINV